MCGGEIRVSGAFQAAGLCQLLLTSEGVLVECPSVEMGQQMRLTLLRMTLVICVHQGAPWNLWKSGVSQQWIRWGNPNVSQFCLLAVWKPKSRYKGLLGFYEWILLSDSKTVGIRSNKRIAAVAVAAARQVSLGLLSLSPQREPWSRCCPANGLESRAAWRRVRNLWEVEDKCRGSEGCCPSRWKHRVM